MSSMRRRCVQAQIVCIFVYPICRHIPLWAFFSQDRLCTCARDPRYIYEMNISIFVPDLRPVMICLFLRKDVFPFNSLFEPAAFHTFYNHLRSLQFTCHLRSLTANNSPTLSYRLSLDRSAYHTSQCNRLHLQNIRPIFIKQHLQFRQPLARSTLRPSNP